MAVSQGVGLALALAAVAYAVLAVVVWRRREIPGSAGLLVCLLAVGTWSLCYALELTSPDLATARFWSAAKFVGIVLLAPGLWAFVLRYTAHSSPLPARVVALLLVHPVLVVGLLAVPATHDLVHYYPLERGDPAGQDYVLGTPVPDSGPLFWPQAIYLYVMLLGAVVLFVSRLLRLTRAHRRQGAVLIAASLLPFLGNLVYLVWLPDSSVDPSPFLFGVLAVVAVWGIMRVRLVGALRVARSVVVDRLADPVVVVDVAGHVADLNPAAETFLGVTRDQVLGTVLVTRLPDLAPVLGRHTSRATTTADLTVGEATVAVQVTSVLENGAEAGRIVVLRDVSASRATQARLLALLDEQTRIAGTLSGSLRPPSLPDVDGVELAARWVPAGAELSGDFYDVHPAGPGRWAFVMGDVVGKGVHAAVVTALARHTVRALSAQGLGAVEVVEALNEALLSDDAERFCTVVYGQLTPSEGGGVDAVVVLGGHPQPLLRCRDGAVRAVGVPGTALGLLAPVEVHAAHVHLDPGDVLLLYTDGVTEARSRYADEVEEFGEDHLAAVVAAAGEGAEVVTDAVLQVLTALAEQRDDLALLAVSPRAGRTVS